MTLASIVLSVIALIVFLIGILLFENRIRFWSLLALVGSLAIASVVARQYYPAEINLTWLQTIGAYLAIGVVMGGIHTVYGIVATYFSYFLISRDMKKQGKITYLRDKGQGAVEFLKAVNSKHGHGQNELIPEYQISGYISRISPSYEEARKNPLAEGNANSAFVFKEFVQALHVSGRCVANRFVTTFACWPYVLVSSLTFSLSKKILKAFMAIARKVNELLLSSIFPKSPDDGEAR